MKVTILFLGSTGAGPVYSLEMAKSICEDSKKEYQIIISKECCNKEIWHEAFDGTSTKIMEVSTYSHTKVGLFLSYFQVWKIRTVIKKIEQFDTDVLYVPFFLPWSPLLYPILKGKVKIIHTLHDPIPHDDTRNPLIKIFSIATFKSYKYVDDIVILNKKDIDYCKSHFCEKVHVIPHASFKYYNKKDCEANTNLNYTIGFFGRIEPYKGIDLLIDAFEKIKTKNIHLIIAGSGNVEQNIHDVIISNKKIKLINRYIEDDEFSELFSMIDFVVLPYKRASQSGVVPMAFSFGKTVVATNVGALSEQIPQGTGIVVEPNSTLIAESIDKLYSTPNLILDYNKNAKKYADTELSWEHSADLFHNILDQLSV